MAACAQAMTPTLAKITGAIRARSGDGVTFDWHLFSQVVVDDRVGVCRRSIAALNVSAEMATTCLLCSTPRCAHVWSPDGS
jgi:hypothetical protein